MDSRLDYMDHGSYLGFRALGRQPLFVMTWLYDRPVDMAELQRFVSRLDQGMLGRLVDPSPIFGGRPRWVRAERSTGIDLAADARSREELPRWADELATLPIDPIRGPGWRLGVLPLTDGGTAVAIVIPHLLGDGVCKTQAIIAAVNGTDVPACCDHGRRRGLGAVAAEITDMVRSLPETFAALRAVLAVLRHRRASLPAAHRDARPFPTGDGSAGSYFPPEAAVLIDTDEWDACAQRRGGTSNSLFAGIAARLALQLGRTLVDGSVALALPVSTRSADDTRANALDSVTFAVDPHVVTRDLEPIRDSTRAVLAALRRDVGSQRAVLPLVRWIPAWLVGLLEGLVLSGGSSPVGCSNLGTLDPRISRIDGGEAARVTFRVREHFGSAAELDRLGGQLFCSSARIGNDVLLGTAAHVRGGPNDDEELLEELTRALDAFGLTSKRV